MNISSPATLSLLALAQNLQQRENINPLDEQTINARLVAEINQSSSTLPATKLDLQQVLCLLKIRRLIAAS